jgi:hypothetical protein
MPDSQRRAYLMERSEDGANGCRNWTGQTIKDGYGRFRRQGKKVLAHRVAWELDHGPIPPGMCICHRCDNPRCVNVSHLFLGSHADNMADKGAKGRTNAHYGSAASAAKLTEEEALAIFHTKGNGREIAARFGINHRTVSAIKTKRIWRHIHGLIPSKALG